MRERTVAVIGAGVIGVGVTQSVAQAGWRTILVDNSSEALSRVPGLIRDGVRLFNFKATKEKRVKLDEVESRLYLTSSIEDIAVAEVVVENVTEKWELKREIYHALSGILPDSALLLINTSVIPIRKAAAEYRLPERVVGVHFMNPVPLKTAVELIRGPRTAKEALADTREFLRGIGKEPVPVNDSPGFVSNRVLMLTINEAIRVLEERVAGRDEVDAVFKKCFGHPMGPLETADMIGNDTILYSLEGLYENLRDGRFEPAPLLREMVEAGLLGRKSGRGFYNYKEEKV
jgi:3-hydroxybutyryl-CoA dehydrogenase